MYEEFFNFMGLREDPFHVSPDPRFYYYTPAHESALSELLFGIETRQGFLVLTGEAGTGKTSLLNLIIDWLHRRGRSTAYIFHTHLEPVGLLRFILNDFGVPCESKCKSVLVAALHSWLLSRHAAQDLPVLILDEAQGLPVQTLDELRLLLNLETPGGKLLQIILSGQPELERKLHLPGLRQSLQRVMFHSRLPALTHQETAAYIRSRLATAGCTGSSLFPDDTVRDIYETSRGIPRIINLLCEHAIISACAERQRVVTREMIQRIAADFDLLAAPPAFAGVELQPRVIRFAPFPVIETAAPAPVPARAFAAAATGSAVVVASQPSPALGQTPANPLPTVTPTPLASPVATVLPPAAEPEVRWRRRPARSGITAFTHGFAKAVQRYWFGFTHASVSYARSARRALSAAIAKPKTNALPNNQPSSVNLWSQIDFSVDKDPLGAVDEFVQVATKPASLSVDPPSTDPVPIDPLSAVAPPSVLEPPSVPRRRPFHSTIAASARNIEAALQHAGFVSIDPLVNYSRSVYRSFVHDCRLWFRGLSLPMTALEIASSPQDENGKSSGQRSLLAPIVNWLQQPFSPGNHSTRRSFDRKQLSRSGKHF
jgi:general secretion pathway protein A